MAKVPSAPGAMQPTSRALRPGVQETTNPTKSKTPAFDLGSIKGPKNTAPGGPTKIGKGIKSMPGMKPPSFKGRPSPRGG
jgi:hypothetical protein